MDQNTLPRQNVVIYIVHWYLSTCALSMSNGISISLRGAVLSGKSVSGDKIRSRSGIEDFFFSGHRGKNEYTRTLLSFKCGMLVGGLSSNG